MKLRDDSIEARWERVTEIVDGALKRPDPRERARFLRAACAGDGALRREVEGLLEYEDAESGVLGGPLLGFCGAAVPAAPEAGGTPAPQHTAGGTPAPQPQPQPGLRPGQTVGPYRVERLLGEGGMGVVALAHDPELDRHVALKVLRRENVDDDLLRRFETERRVLARLDHPNVARIFDAGTAPSGGIGGSARPPRGGSGGRARPPRGGSGGRALTRDCRISPWSSWRASPSTSGAIAGVFRSTSGCASC